MDGLNLPRKLHAFHERGLAGLEDLVVDGVLDSGQEQLLLEKRAMSLMPSALAWSMVALASLTAAMVVGLLWMKQS